MKKSYVKLLIFQIIIFVIILLNSFVSSILSNYNMVLFLFILLIIFKLIFGFEKDRHRHTKNVILDIIIYLVLFFILYYLLGIVIGFAKVSPLSIRTIKSIILPTMLSIIFKEILRYETIIKSEGSKRLYILATFTFVCLNVTNQLRIVNYNDAYSIFSFVALTLLPQIATNLFCNYLVKESGYKPTIFYLLIISLYYYVIPIIPNPSEYIKSVVDLLLPIGLFIKIFNYFKKEHDDFKEREEKKIYLRSLVIPTLLIIVMVYFVSGYFRFKAVAIASGSMEKGIKKGDVVIAEKVNNYDSLKKGDIIVFEYEKVIVVHRINNIEVINGNYFFYTKGDANPKQDNWVLDKTNIRGIVRFKIIKIGVPTVWLNEQFRRKK